MTILFLIVCLVLLVSVPALLLIITARRFKETEKIENYIDNGAMVVNSFNVELKKVNAVLKRKKNGNYFNFYWWDKNNKKKIPGPAI